MKKFITDINQHVNLTPLAVNLLVVILIILLSGCSLTTHVVDEYKHSCELMERGQACLSDHSCCEDDSEEVSYWRTNYTTTEGLYYHNNLPYWGYY